MTRSAGHLGAIFLTAALFLAPGCRDIAPEPGRQHDHSLFPNARADREWYPRGKKGDKGIGTLDPSAVVSMVMDGPVEHFGIMIEPEDTLDLYAKWTGRTVRELLEINKDVKRRGLVAGEGFQLRINRGEFSRFNGYRSAYLAKVRSRRDNGVFVTRVVKHRVDKGENLSEILRRYRTDLDQLEKMNPGVRLAGIRPGQVLNIPIMAPAKDDHPSMPGPKPPAPQPVPSPTTETRAVTVDRGSSVDGRPVVGDYYVVRRGDTAWDLAHGALGVSLKSLEAANPGIDLNRIRPGMRLAVPKGEEQANSNP